MVFGIGAACALLAACPQSLAQQAGTEPVKAGVDAWERGDYAGAVERWRPEALKGNADAQFNLGQAYKLGRGVKPDLNLAEEWYRKAAVQGHPEAQDNYGLILFQNNKRPQALEWLERSAARGEPRAQFVLGTLYFNGDSVARDWVRAYALTTRASQAGLPQASAALSQMDRYISLGDRQKGLTLARELERSASLPQSPITVEPTTPPVRVAAGEKPAPPRQTRPEPRPSPTPRTARPAPAPAPKPTAPPRDGGWRVQLGAFGDAGNARRLWAQSARRFPGRQVYYPRRGPLTRVLVGPYGSRAEAAAACRGISPCVPVTN
ncbi:SPOR domain-containing protein [Sphingomonas sp. HF-S3]|uniref:SPOR domain-containing protein n=1 Tax=Sphingomonas rustica TaxID=3103142 RepID=A0ABV0B9M4_9SPHN